MQRTAASARAMGLVLGGFLGLLGGCGSTGPGERVALSVASQSPTTTVGNDVLVITRAELILRELELEGNEGECRDGSPVPGAGLRLSGPGRSNHEDDENDDHECGEFEAGPFRLTIPLNSVELVVAVDVPAGTYHEVEFEIHKVSGSNAAFAAANPDMVGKSIRVEGTFNGQPFVFESDLEVEQELDLVPPLVVTGTSSTGLTIRVDLGTWFRTAGGGLISPATANAGGPNRDLVRQNIRNSFRVFEDRDRDGREDD